MKTINEIIMEVERHLRLLGYDVAYIGLYGSQNYNLDDEESDIDLRAVVYPTLDDLLDGKGISEKYETLYGDVDVKDIMTYADILSKGNFSFIEPFQSPYYRGDEAIREMFGSVKVNLLAVRGAIIQKLKSYAKHENPKNLSHALRLEMYLYDTVTKAKNPHNSNEVGSCAFKWYDDDDLKHFILMEAKRNRGLFAGAKPYFKEKFRPMWVPSGYDYKEQKKRNLALVKPFAKEKAKLRILEREGIEV